MATKKYRKQIRRKTFRGGAAMAATAAEGSDVTYARVPPKRGVTEKAVSYLLGVKGEAIIYILQSSIEIGTSKSSKDYTQFGIPMPTSVQDKVSLQKLDTLIYFKERYFHPQSGALLIVPKSTTLPVEQFNTTYFSNNLMLIVLYLLSHSPIENAVHISKFLNNIDKKDLYTKNDLLSAKPSGAADLPPSAANSPKVNLPLPETSPDVTPDVTPDVKRRGMFGRLTSKAASGQGGEKTGKTTNSPVVVGQGDQTVVIRDPYKIETNTIM